MIHGYLRIAYGELGTREIPGVASNARIQQYHAVTDGGMSPDDVPWCSSFLCWVMEQDAMPHPRSKRARSWLRWGAPADFPHFGAVVVLKRGGGQQPGPEVQDAAGHVGLFVGFAGASRILVLAGNQGDAVSIDAFPVSQVLGLRVPAAVQGG